MTPAARLSLALVASLLLHLALLADDAATRAPVRHLDVTLQQVPTPGEKDAPDPSILDKNTIATAVKTPLPPPASAPNPRPSRMQASQEARALRKLSQYVLYPPAAIAANHEGTVRLLLKCDTDGNIVSAGVAASSGYPELDDAAVRAAMHAGRIATGGKTEVILPVTFQLQ